jgi:hypothetical protein
VGWGGVCSGMWGGVCGGGCGGVGCCVCGVGWGVWGGGVWVLCGVCVWAGAGGRFPLALEHSKVCTLCDFGHLQF